MHPAQPVCGKESFMSYIISPPEDAALQAHLHKLRTQLHEDPELSWQEHRTTRLVRQELEALCLEPVPLGLPTGTAALLRGALPGPTVGLRADLDALPITERTGAEFSSRVPGCLLYTSTENIVQWAEAFGTVPIYKEARESAEFQQFAETNIAVKALTEEADDIGMLASVPGAAAMRTEIDKMVQSVALNVSDADTAYAAFETACREALAK